MTEQKTPWQILGSYALSDVTDLVLVVICKRCDRRGRYNVERLRAAHRDIPLPDPLNRLAADGCEAKDPTVRCGLSYDSPMSQRDSAASRPVDALLPTGRMTPGQMLAQALKPR